MQIGNATLEFEPFPIGVPGIDGSVVAGDVSKPEDVPASRALYHEQRQTFFWYDCQDGSSRQRRLDGMSNLVIGPALIIFGKPQKTRNGFTMPGNKSRQATLDAFAAATGLKTARALSDALGAQLGSASVSVPWVEIRDNHKGTVSYEVSYEADMVALRVKLAGGALPGDIFLLVPMSVLFYSDTTGVCVDGKFHDDLIWLSPYHRVFYPPETPVHLSGPVGRGLQRDEAKKRVDAIEKEMADIRSGLTPTPPFIPGRETISGDGLSSPEDAKKEALDQLRREIDELIKY